jgi:hypothetical protein
MTLNQHWSALQMVMLALKMVTSTLQMMTLALQMVMLALKMRTLARQKPQGLNPRKKIQLARKDANLCELNGPAHVVADLTVNQRRFQQQS